MYARTIGSRTLTFGVSGMLFRDALVMYDRETDSLWTQVDGRAIRGPQTGQTLEPLPSVHATWKEWKAAYPDSLVLKKRGEFRTPYAGYNRDPGKLGIMGRRNQDTRLPPKERILGVRSGGEATAFPLQAVRDARLVHAQVGGLPIVLVAPGDTLPITVYERRAGGRVLTFELAGDARAMLRDRETATLWRASDGVAVEGPLSGTRLARAVAHGAFWFGWRGFFPNSAIWRPEPPGGREKN